MERLLIATSLLVLVAVTGRTRAEEPVLAPAAASLLLAPELAVNAKQLAVLEDIRLQRKRLRVRRMLTVGVAVTGSAVVHAIWAASVRDACFGDPERRGLHTASLYAAGGVATVGIILAFVGGSRLVETASARSTTTTVKERAILGVLGLGSAAVTQLLLGIVRLGDNGFCAS